MMMQQYRFIDYNEGITLVGAVDDKEGYACVGQAVYEKSLYSLNFSVNLKLP